MGELMGQPVGRTSFVEVIDVLALCRKRRVGVHFGGPSCMMPRCSASDIGPTAIRKDG
jgi:hypothetical protein